MIQRRHRANRSQIRESCPNQPGVYGMINSSGEVIYVGMSGNLQQRLPAYFSNAPRRKRERRIRRRACAVIWQALPHELLARLREQELIRQFRPEWNVVGRPSRVRVAYLIELSQLAPGFKLVSKLPRQSNAVWGPVPDNRLSRKGVESLNLHFGLRDCSRQTPMHFVSATSPAPDTLSPPGGCLRGDLQTCLAPCVAACSEQEYSRKLAEARSFLNGCSDELLQSVTEQMQLAAQAREFEKAARLRDRLRAFEYLHDRLRRFHDWSSRANFAYPLHTKPETATVALSELWLIVEQGRVRTLADQFPSARQHPYSEQGLHAARGSMGTELQTGEFEASRLLYRWFRKHPQERKRCEPFS